MKRATTLAGVTVASLGLVLALAHPAYAWHPEGVIVKEVQNVTQGSELADANTAEAAVAAQTGDTLKYVITVRNDGKYSQKGWNDMYFTKVVDTLPAGVELDEGQTNQELGRIAAGEAKTYQFTATVAAGQDGTICNTASFTGDSEVEDNPQSGEDDACVDVTVPAAPTPEPKPEPTPEKPVGKGEAPAEIPATGPAAALSAVLGISSLAGAGHAYLRSRRFVK